MFENDFDDILSLNVIYKHDKQSTSIFVVDLLAIVIIT